MSESSRNTTDGNMVEVAQDYAVLTLIARSPDQIDEVLSQTGEESRRRIQHGISLVRKYGEGLARSFGLSDETIVSLPSSALSSVSTSAQNRGGMDVEYQDYAHGDLGYYGSAGSHEDLDGK